jgi:hypothetical protein
MLGTCSVGISSRVRRCAVGVSVKTSLDKTVDAELFIFFIIACFGGRDVSHIGHRDILICVGLMFGFLLGFYSFR